LALQHLLLPPRSQEIPSGVIKRVAVPVHDLPRAALPAEDNGTVSPPQTPVQIPLSLLFLELSGYYVNAVQLHVHAADVLVRCGIHREGFR
jgi:hypothetical protein